LLDRPYHWQQQFYRGSHFNPTGIALFEFETDDTNNFYLDSVSLSLVDPVLHYYDLYVEFTPTVSSGSGENLRKTPIRRRSINLLTASSNLS